MFTLAKFRAIFRSMTGGYWVILAGLLLIAFGTLLGFYGSQLNNRADNAKAAAVLNNKITEVFTQIAAAQSAPAPSTSASVTPSGVHGTSAIGTVEARTTVSEVRDEFAEWASNFTQNRSAKRLELDRLKIESTSEELRISAKCRPLFQCAIQRLRQAISAYNTSAATAYQVTLRDLPDNLYETHTDIFEIGTIDFSAAVVWTLRIVVFRPARDDSPPVFFCDINPVGTPPSGVLIEIRWDTETMRIKSYGGGIAGTARIDRDGTLSDYDTQLRDAFQRLLEAQISSLTQPAQ